MEIVNWWIPRKRLLNMNIIFLRKVIRIIYVSLLLFYSKIDIAFNL
jgi:hypothetical protein